MTDADYKVFINAWCIRHRFSGPDRDAATATLKTLTDPAAENSGYALKAIIVQRAIALNIRDPERLVRFDDSIDDVDLKTYWADVLE